MTTTPFYVSTAPQPNDRCPRKLIYVALTGSPDLAVQAVRRLVGTGPVLTVTGETMSPLAARALGLRPGQARLV